ncbi:flagellar hook-basal body protein [Konateibacter massiliensis]|uniref:flagellar hook-basal body protein n=1 Tax=Konateibacter massiliensis TaxID=2002841 RepID=UPI000C146CAA|nr:flagellar hook-basal body protein [Konateibacter massiliensis]
MVKGLYTAYTGMLNEQNRMDVITNNMANASTYGYKAEGATAQSFADVYGVKIKDASSYYVNKRIGTMSMGAQIGETYTNYDQGSFKETGNTYDIALEGNGFFSISFTNKSGETSTKYTRDGSFTVNTQGYLVTKDGDFVLGNGNNPIRLNLNETTTIDTLGNIYQDGAVVNKLAVTDFTNYDYLEKYGENMYNLVEGGTAQASTARVRQGFIEASNVNVVSEMVNMIQITRAYETNQKVITTIDGTLDKAVNTVGKL